MNGIAFAPHHDTAGSGDVSRYHRPASKAWCDERGLPSPFLYDNRRPRFERTKQITRELMKHRTALDAIAFFGYAGAAGTQTGFSVENIKSLAVAILASTSERSTIEFFSTDPAIDSSGLCADGGFAEKLSTALRGAGKWCGEVVAHAVNADGDLICRVFDGAGQGVWVSG